MFEYARLENTQFPAHKANPTKAFKLAKSAAAKGDCCAMTLMGDLEASAFAGHKPNSEAAVNWYKRAARKNCDDGWDRLQRLNLKKSFSIERNDQNRKTAKCQNCVIQAARLEMEDFPGHKPNPAKAIAWYTKAINLGSDDAKLELGKLYIDLGAHDAQLGQALFWLNAAKEAGSQEATVMLENLASETTADVEEQILMSLETEKLIGDCRECVENEEEMETADEAEDEIDTAFQDAYLESLNFSQYDEKANNKKALRSANVKQLSTIYQRVSISEDVRVSDLSSNNQQVWQMLQENELSSITYADLFHFANDPALLGKFSYGSTKCGVEFTLVAVVNGVKRHASVGSHRKHNKSYKNINRDFVRDFRKMVGDVLDF